MPRYFLELAYKGTQYHGFQNQPHCISVQSELERVLCLIFKTPTKIVGCGRTDAGVHATQFFAHFDLQQPIENMQKSIWHLNNLLHKDIAIYQLFPVKETAHARFDAVYRKYEYHLSFRKDPFHHAQTLFVFQNLDFEKMQAAAKLLLNYRDFASFAKTGSDVTHFECNLFESYVEQRQNIWVYHVAANRFLRGMVRALVGTLLEVGKGKLTLDDFQKVIEEKNRSRAGKSARPHALFLTRVRYKKEIFI